MRQKERPKAVRLYLVRIPPTDSPTPPPTAITRCFAAISSLSLSPFPLPLILSQLHILLLLL